MPTVELDIRQLAEEGGTNPIAPTTVTDAVLDEDGNTLTDILDEINAGLVKFLTVTGTTVTSGTLQTTLQRDNAVICGGVITSNTTETIVVSPAQLTNGYLGLQLRNGSGERLANYTCTMVIAYVER